MRRRPPTVATPPSEKEELAARTRSEEIERFELNVRELEGRTKRLPLIVNEVLKTRSGGGRGEKEGDERYEREKIDGEPCVT